MEKGVKSTEQILGDLHKKHSKKRKGIKIILNILELMKKIEKKHIMLLMIMNL